MIYLVEDDESIRELVVYTLNSQGMEAEGFGTPSDFWKALENKVPDLILLDIMLPEEDGLDILAKLRKKSDTKNLPIAMLTAKGSEYDTVKGLDSGADDYLGKPFALKEVQARLNALIRRSGGQAAAVIKYKDIEFNPQTRKVLQNGKEIVLAPKELALLELLLLNKNRVLSKEVIENKIYSWDEEVSSNAVEVHIHHLRKKLGKDVVKTVNKIGYILEDA